MHDGTLIASGLAPPIWGGVIVFASMAVLTWQLI